MHLHKKTQTGIFLLFLSLAVQSQTPLSMVQLRTVKGSLVSFGALTKKDSLVLVCFWASWSEKSIQELNAINAVYQGWKSIPSLKLMAVSVDEGKSSNKGQQAAEGLRKAAAKDEAKTERNTGHELAKGADRFDERSRSSDGKSALKKQKR